MQRHITEYGENRKLDRVAHDLLLAEFRKLSDKIDPILENHRDNVGFYRKSIKIQNFFKHIVAWPIIGAGLYKILELLGVVK